MDVTDKKLLNLLQQNIPLLRKPFAYFGKKTGISEEECIQRIKALKRKKIIREISGIFDTHRLGYKSTLVAMKIAEKKLEGAAEIVNRHPGVSHNYRRKHSFNLWFTLSVPSGVSLKKHLNKLSELTGAEKTFYLPTIKLFKIGVNFDLSANSSGVKQEKKKKSVANNINGYKLNKKDKEVIIEFQKNLELTPQPFEGAASRLNLTLEEYFTRIKYFQEKGIMRRFSAVIRHRNAGFKANAMVVWKVPRKEIERVGNVLASYKAVSHCYQRPTYRDWPYPLFTMIHAREKGECETIIGDMIKKSGIEEHLILFSTKEYKKERIKYFSPEIKVWEKEMFKR